jgi:hypothetical protein
MSASIAGTREGPFPYWACSDMPTDILNRLPKSLKCDCQPKRDLSDIN